jgi:hypothetical protein
VAGVSGFGIYPGLWVRRAPILPTTAKHAFFIRGRRYGAVQRHSETLVAILCVGLEGIIAAPLLSMAGPSVRRGDFVAQVSAAERQLPCWQNLTALP